MTKSKGGKKDGCRAGCLQELVATQREDSCSAEGGQVVAVDKHLKRNRSKGNL